MKGNREVIERLNEVLGAELVAINQYFLHAKLCASWGYEALAKHVREESIDEMRHAEALIDRILFLDGVPNLQKLDKLNIGTTVPEQLRSDLALERAALKLLGASIDTCRKEGDVVSERLLLDIAAAEERHVQWIETQLALLDKLGETLYLSRQVG